MKKFFITIIAILLPLLASAKYNYDAYIDGVYYNFNSSTKTAIVTYQKFRIDDKEGSYDGNVIIPPKVTYQGVTYNVTSISDQAFCYCNGLTSITIPNSVTSIGIDAFYNCSGLTSITIPNSVTSIGIDAFYNCSGLTSIKVESGNQTFDSRNNCNAIIEKSSNTLIAGCKNTIIPNSVTSIGWFAFRGCSGLTSITIPNSVTSIGIAAFSGCSGLTSVTIPNNVISIGSGVFSGCSGLTSVTIPSGVTSIGGSAFSDCSGLTSVTIPNSVTSIGSYAFSRCSSLTSITIPNSVTSIGAWAFQSCSGLTSITIPNSVTSIDDGTFSRCSGLTSVTIPNSVTSIGGDAFFDCSRLTSVTIPNSVTSIGRDAFSGTPWFNNQPNGLVYAGKVAYKYKGDMPENTSIIIEDGTVGIADYAFYNCIGLTFVTIPNGVESIGSWAFYNCSSLTSVTIPNGVTSIGWGAFSDTPWFNNQPNGLVYAGKVAYEYKGEMPENTSIIIENGTVEIAGSAFSSCTDLTSITIPNSVTSIGDQAFRGCSGLTSVTIPNSVTSIGDQAFYGCSGLTSITIPNSVTSIGAWAFYGCSGLTSITIPSSVTSIDDGTFSGCSGLTSVTIPNSVTSIGTNAFYTYSGLTSILSLNNTPPAYSTYSFNNDNKENCVLWVPKGSASAYTIADGWKDFQNIKELKFGDVNLDGDVNQADLDAIVDFIMDKDPEGFYESQADLNGDDVVDAADVVKLITILNMQEGLSMDYQAKYSNQVISSLSCTLNNDGDKAIQLTKCELYFNQSLVSSSKFKVTLASGGSKKCSFDDLASLSTRTGFSLVWYYTYNGEDYTYRCEIEE